MRFRQEFHLSLSQNSEIHSKSHNGKICEGFVRKMLVEGVHDEKLLNYDEIRSRLHDEFSMI